MITDYVPGSRLELEPLAGRDFKSSHYTLVDALPLSAQSDLVQPNPSKSEPLVTNSATSDFAAVRVALSGERRTR